MLTSAIHMCQSAFAMWNNIKLAQEKNFIRIVCVCPKKKLPLYKYKTYESLKLLTVGIYYLRYVTNFYYHQYGLPFCLLPYYYILNECFELYSIQFNVQFELKTLYVTLLCQLRGLLY